MGLLFFPMGVLPTVRRRRAVNHDPEDSLEAIEEAVIVAVPICRAYEGWTACQASFVYLSGTESSRAAGGSDPSGGCAWGDLDARSDQRIAWFRIFDGNSHAGAVVFSPLDAGNTLVSVRFTGAASDLAPDICGVEIVADLLRFKEFVESRPAVA